MVSVTASSNEKKRQASDFPAPSSVPDSKKRQITGNGQIDSAISLALDHLLHDQPTPLYRRDAEEVVDRVLVDDEPRTAIFAPLLRVLALVQTKDTKSSPQKVQQVREELATVVTQRLLRHVGNSLAETLDLRKRGRNMHIHYDADGYRLGLSIKPVLEVGDEHVEEQSNTSIGGVKDTERQKHLSGLSSNFQKQTNNQREAESDSTSEEENGN